MNTLMQGARAIDDGGIAALALPLQRVAQRRGQYVGAECALE
jgi:hypothetical protein